MFQEYKKSSYYWEFIKMYEKAFIATVLNLYIENYELKGLLLILINSLYLLLIIKHKPFHNVLLNSIDLESTILIVASIFLTMIAGLQNYFMTLVSLIAIVLFNALFVL
jgi:hypothetical protein